VHRKVVTVMFCDVVDSTALGESTDPEALQAQLARYFDEMKASAMVAQVNERLAQLTAVAP
jgi:class 3 adenylate cyclase